MSGVQPTVRMHPAAAWAVLLVASLGVFLGGAELMVVAIALPSIVVDFGGWADLARASWIVNGYLLAYLVAMPLAGRAADLWGARRLYVVALLLFCAGSLGAGLSRLAGNEAGLAWLIGMRVVQGFGGGALVPLSMALASHLFVGRTRAAALGVEGAATFVGMAVGPAYGAWVLLNVSLPLPGVDLAAWQWIFFLNVPAGMITLLLIYVVAGGVETPRASGGIDLLGALLISITLVAGVGALTLAGQRGWTDPLILGGFAVLALALVAFVVRELRLPTAVTALTVGTALGVAGPLFQRMLGNPLASPDILGITANSVAALSYRAREGLRKAWLQAHVSEAEESDPHRFDPSSSRPMITRMISFVPSRIWCTRRSRTTFSMP